MKNYIIIIFFTFSSAVFSQEKSAEEYYQECLYSSLSDKGIALKRYAKGFENHLIELEILKDASSKSYYDLFKSFSEGKSYQRSYKYSFIDSINNKLERNRIIPFNTVCYDEMLKLKKFKDSKLFKIQAEMTLNSSNAKFSKQMKRVISVLDEEDFELDFYKQRTFIYLYFSNFYSRIDTLFFEKGEK